jgi:hypothetical protein
LTEDKILSNIPFVATNERAIEKQSALSTSVFVVSEFD